MNKHKTSVDAAQDRAAKSAASKAMLYASPFLATVGELGASAAIHSAWGDPAVLPWVSAGLSMSTVACTALVWQVARDRSGLGRWHAAATAALTGTHLVASAIAGPFVRPLIDLWAWAGATNATAWAIRLHVAAGGPADELDSGVFGWRKAAEITGGSIEKSKFRPDPKHTSADRVKGRLELEAGETADDAQKVRGRLASVLGLPPNGVRMAADPDNARLVDLTLVRRDMLRGTVEYTPSGVGGSSAEPYRVGVREDGAEALAFTHVPGQGEVHLLIMGMTGAGKTEGAKTLIGEEFGRTDVFTIVVDVVKGAQTLGPMLPGLKWVVRSEDQAHALMTALKERVIPARAEYLGRKRLKAWEPGCGIPRLRVHVEEGAGLFLGNSDFVRVMERARSVGVQITLSGQRFSYTSIDVAARSQFGAVWCFGLADIADARFAMPDDVLDAGADPSVWKANRPGCSYLLGPGIDPAEHTTPMRAALIDDEDLEDLARYNALHGAELDETTRAAFGELYTHRTTGPQILAELAGETPAPAADVQPPRTRPTEEDDVDALLAGLPDDERPEPYRAPAGDPEPALQPDLDAELPDVPDMAFGAARDETAVSPEQAKALLAQALADAQAAGHTEIRGRDLADVARAAQRSPAWIYKQLDARVKAGELARTDTGFRFARTLVSA